MGFGEADLAWLQDRHTLIEHLSPESSADWAAVIVEPTCTLYMIDY